jgi:hypothetical protein
MPHESFTIFVFFSLIPICMRRLFLFASRAAFRRWYRATFLSVLVTISSRSIHTKKALYGIPCFLKALRTMLRNIIGHETGLTQSARHALGTEGSQRSSGCIKADICVKPFGFTTGHFLLLCWVHQP